MKTLLKITLLVGTAASTIALPVSAGEHMAGLRGMSNAYTAVSEFESRYNTPVSQHMDWQHRQLPQVETKTRYVSSRFAPSSHTQGTSSRYGAPKPQAQSKYGNVYDYESGHCGQACAAPIQRRVPAYATYAMPAQPTYTAPSITQYKCWDGEIVTDENGCKRETITQTIPQFRCWDGEIVTDENGCKRQTITRQVLTTASAPVECPMGTTPQSDGTCMESETPAYVNPYAGYSVELRGGTVETPPSQGYIFNGGNTNYMPIRK